MLKPIQDAVERIAKTLYDKKAEDIVAIYIADRTVIADYFIVCSGRNNILTKALADEVEERLEDVLPLRRKEGYNEGRWIVLDYADILVHIFHPEERAYYNVERLWKDDSNLIDYTEKLNEEEREDS